jgi:hypothetical protein
MVAFLDTEAWRDVSWNVGMPLLIPAKHITSCIRNMKFNLAEKTMSQVHLPLVFLNIVEVVPANNNGSVHLSTVASSCDNSASDRNCSSEWALLVNVGACIKEKFNNLANTSNITYHILLLYRYHELIVFKKLEVKSGVMHQIMSC